MSTWKDQQMMQRTQRQQFFSCVFFKMTIVVTLLGVVSTASNETNNSDAFTDIDNNSARTSSIRSTTVETSLHDTSKLLLIPDADDPISFSISVAGFTDVPAHYVANITTPNANISSNSVVATTDSNITNGANITSHTNPNSVNLTNGITSLILDNNVTDFTRTRSFWTVTSFVNSTDISITITDVNTTTSTQINITDSKGKNATITLPVTSASPIVEASTKPTVTDSLEGDSPTTCALTECQRLHSSHAPPLSNVSWWAVGGEEWAGFAAGGGRLATAARLHELATVQEGAEWAVLCVGVVRLAFVSRRNATTATPDAGVELETARDVPAGLVRLRTRCWLDTGLFSACSSSFIPMPYFMNLPFHDLSPFDVAFWTQLTKAVMEVKATWIREINITTFKGSVPSQWISNMHISSLKNLYITGNDWNDTEEILGNMSQLIGLDLSNNNIKSLPEEIFEDMPLLESLILNKNSLSKCPSSMSRLTNLLQLNLSNSIGKSSLRIEEKDIQLFPRNIKILEVSNSKLQARLEDILLLPELLFLNISKNRVKMFSVPSATSKVKILDVSENRLRITPKNFFSAMPALEILILNRNRLYELPIFPDQNNLTHLYASGNLLVSLLPRAFANLRGLQVLDVSRCKIHSLESAFVNTFSLQKVFLSHNLIRDIPEYLFSSLLNLQEVDLSYNYLTTVYLWKWKVRMLDFSSNRLIHFRSNMSAIEYINLSFNHMQNIDNVQSSVQKLNISHNLLTYLSPTLWNNISQSLEVDLGGNYFLCCSFENTMYLSEHYFTEVLNLGSAEPIKCHINSEVSEILFQTNLYNGNQCRTDKESITTFAIVLPLLIAVTLAAVLIVLTLFVIQFNRKKFIVKHSLDNVIRNTTM